ncbi:sialidase family protein [Mycoplasmopsis agassizii]|uniref:sialidase family protein n=1 Tax=Mycoplasmopsis agassizii TaxID=33922 RepID=UPI00352804E7
MKVSKKFIAISSLSLGALTLTATAIACTPSTPPKEDPPTPPSKPAPKPIPDPPKGVDKEEYYKIIGWYDVHQNDKLSVADALKEKLPTEITSLKNSDLKEPLKGLEGYNVDLKLVKNSARNHEGTVLVKVTLEKDGKFYGDNGLAVDKLEKANTFQSLVSDLKVRDIPLAQQTITVEQIYKEFGFTHNLNHKHSYRIPSVGKYNGKLYLQIDGRIDNQSDAPYNRINQSIRTYDLKTKTMSEMKDLITVKANSREKITLIDSSFTIDEKNHIAHLIVDAMPSDSGVSGRGKNAFIQNNKIDISGIYNSGNLKLLDRVNDVFVEFNIKDKSKKWYQAYKPETKEKLPIALNLEVQGDQFLFDVYEMADATKELSDKSNLTYIQSAMEIFKDYNKNDLSPSKYKLITQVFLSWFTIDLKTDKVTFEGFLNDKLNKTNRTAIDLVGPGNGLILRNQAKEEDNGKLIFANYRMAPNGAHYGVYFMIKDKDGKWTSTKFIANGSYSETNIVEQQDGTLVFVARNTLGKLAIGYSYDGGRTFTNKAKEEGKIDLYGNLNILSTVLQGIEYFRYKGDDYLLISAPTKDGGRTHGKLYLIKNNDFEKAKEIYEFNGAQNRFEYSALKLVEVEEDGIQLAAFYEARTPVNEGTNNIEMALEILKLKID